MGKIREKTRGIMKEIWWLINPIRKRTEGELTRYGYILSILPRVHWCAVCGRRYRKFNYQNMMVIIEHKGFLRNRYYCLGCYDAKLYGVGSNER